MNQYPELASKDREEPFYTLGFTKHVNPLLLIGEKPTLNISGHGICKPDGVELVS